MVTEDRLSPGEVHSLLAARRRRYVLYCLYLYSNPMGLPDVAGTVAEWEHGVPRDECLTERLHIYNSLYHNHVPKLAEFGVVRYSQSEDMIELTRGATQLRPHLKHAAETDLETTDISL